MRKLKPIQTEYNGYLFRSRLEARWAVFFDACGVDYNYSDDYLDTCGYADDSRNSNTNAGTVCDGSA